MAFDYNYWLKIVIVMMVEKSPFGHNQTFKRTPATHVVNLTREQLGETLYNVSYPEI